MEDKFVHNKKLTNVAKMLRKNSTREERKLWYDFLKDYPVRVLRQKVIGNYIVDFYCKQANLVIELDGMEHYTEEGLANDDERTAFLESFGLEVIRIDNMDIRRNFGGVCGFLDVEISTRANTEPIWE